MNMLYISSSLCIIIPLLLLMLANILFMRSFNDREKSSPFECGFDPVKSARIPFSTRFFLLAVIFIVFDIEIVLLIPIPLLLYSQNPIIIITAFSMFMLILLMGLYHEWMEGSLNWTK